MASLAKSLAILLFVCSLRPSALAQEVPLKHVPLFTYVVDYEASWSPNGRQIVLISSRHGGMKVHIVDTSSTSNGSDLRQITFGPNEDDSPAWSPDGRQIAFVSIHNSVSDIFVVNIDGSDLRQVTRDLGQNIHPMWSPDGSRILFNTTQFSDTHKKDQSSSEHRVIGEVRDEFIDIATIRPDGTDLRRITRGGGYTYASFSPDGRAILHRRQQGELSQIFLMNADGSDDHNLSRDAAVDGWPAWSPDGKRIVFSRRTESGFQIFVMNREGGGVRQLTNAMGEFTNPRWSPDGKKILAGRRLGGINLVVFDAPH